MKTIQSFISVLLFVLLLSGSYAQTRSIIVQNSLNVHFSKQIVAANWQEIKKKFPDIQPTNFKVVDSKTNKEIPFQLEYKGQSEIQNLLMQINVPAKSTQSFKIIKGIPAKVVAKVYCRYVPERKDDFAWENDKIAFRVYGKSLEDFPNEMGLGNDVWVKSTDTLILNTRYKRGEYHIDHGDGCDYYHVGLSLGAGGIAPFYRDSICYSKNYRSYKILDNGPLRCSFELNYDEWSCNGKMISVKKVISFDAGSQLNKSEIVYNLKNEDSTLPVVTGIVKRKENGVIFANEQDGITGYWEPTDKVNGTTGVGCLFESPVDNININNEQILTKLILKNHQTFTYYFGAVWNKAGVITTPQQWFDYLRNFQTLVKTPLIVTIK